MSTAQVSAELRRQDKDGPAKLKRGAACLRKHPLSPRACQHTGAEAASCLLIPGAVLLLVGLQLAVLLDLGPRSAFPYLCIFEKD
jgi:hypothetical protein